MRNKNDAEHLVQIINDKRHFEGKPLANAVMVWQCTVEGCKTLPKPQRRGQYENRLKCNACANREKSKNPEFLVKRGKAISSAIKEAGDKWSVVATKNMANEETRNKISQSMKTFMKDNDEASEIRRQTALKNNEFSGFGTKEFSENMWATRSEEEKRVIGEKITLTQLKTSKEEHIALMNERAPGFQLIEIGRPDNLYRCPKDHLFYIRGNNFLKRLTCPECSTKSQPELDLFKKVEEMLPDARRNKRVLYLDDTKNGNRALEIDVYSEGRSFGVECHGNYYHQECIVGDKHQKKADLADKWGITLLQFFEDELAERMPIVESLIRSKIGMCDHKIGARECEIVELNNSECRDFLNSNHLQGSCGAFLKIGLKFKNEIVSVLTFRKFRDKSSNKITDAVEIARFCNKTNHIIHASFAKLLNNAIPKLKILGFTRIVSYSDRRYSDGNVYELNGFSHIRTTDADMFWYKRSCRYPRQLSWGKTDEKMFEDGYTKIRGAGHKLWLLNI